jgi:hypothetical protein
MATYEEQLVKLWEEYEASTEQELNDPDHFANWAISSGRWRPRPKDIRKQLRADLTTALRNVQRTDPDGITYRAKRCVRIEDEGIEMSLWFDTDKATRSVMQKSVAQQRKGLVDNAFRLKCDVDHFNNASCPDDPIQLVLDLTDDVAELEHADREERDEAA